MTSVACPECGRLCADARGLGGHRRQVHGVQGTSKSSAQWHAGKRWGHTKKKTRTALQQLTGADRGVLERLTGFIVQAPTDRGLVVAGATFGPRFVARQYVGDIVRQAKEPCIVLELEQLAAQCNRQEAVS